jgi:hypothetical protein
MFYLFHDLYVILYLNSSVTASPLDSRMTMSSALAWAEKTAGISRNEALLQLKRTALLSGSTGVTTSYYLTFSVFLIYAVHCFTAHAYLQNDLFEEIFEACLQQMIKQISTHLDRVQDLLQIDIDILETMFGNVSNVSKDSTELVKEDKLCTEDRLTLISHALSDFDAHIGRNDLPRSTLGGCR